MIESLSVYGGNELNRFLGDRRPGQGLFDDGGEGTIGMKSFLASAQDRRIARFQAKSGTVDRNVRAGFVNDPDDPDGGSDLSDVQTVGPILFLDDLANGIGKADQLTNPWTMPSILSWVRRRRSTMASLNSFSRPHRYPFGFLRAETFGWTQVRGLWTATPRSCRKCWRRPILGSPLGFLGQVFDQAGMSTLMKQNLTQDGQG